MAGTSGLPVPAFNRLIEIVFSFDTTGSMSSILEEVRGRLQDMIQRLQSDIPGIRIGVIAHGDYCDKDVFYLTREIDLCQNVAELCQFVTETEGTGGGDADECYELILRMIRENMSWTAGSQKIVVMIGDANPHEPDYELNTDNIDWREELKLMKTNGIKVYGVQAFSNEGVEDFYKSLASETDGHYLKLTEFSNICDMMMAICYAERGEEYLMNYENEVRSRFGAAKTVPKDIEGMFGTLRRDDSLRSNSSSVSVPLAPHIHPSPTKVAAIKPTPRKRKATDDTPDVNDDDKRPIKIRKTTRKRQDRPFRETIPSTIFEKTCGCESKPKWQLVYSPQKPKSSVFRPRCLRNKNRYWKKKIAFPRMTDDRGVYELAVQTKSCKRLQAVYCNIHDNRKSKLMRTDNWENVIFRSKAQKTKIMKRIRNATANKGCRVFLRKLQYSKKTIDAISGLDYDWKHLKAGRVL